MIHCGRLFQVIVKQGRCKCFGFLFWLRQFSSQSERLEIKIVSKAGISLGLKKKEEKNVINKFIFMTFEDTSYEKNVKFLVELNARYILKNSW